MSEDREIIITPYARLSFPRLAEAHAFKSGDSEKFSCSLLFPKVENAKKDREDGNPFSPWGDPSKHDLSHLEQVIENYVNDTWPAKKRPSKLKLPFKDGDEEKWDGYAGHIFIRVSTTRAPKLFDTRRNEITGEDIKKVFYAGAWVRAIVNPFDYNESGNIGVSFGLQGLQFIRDDKEFTGGVTAESFDDLPDSDLAPDDLDDLD